MSMRANGFVLLWASVATLNACVSTPVPFVDSESLEVTMTISPDTVRLEGWFSARGEWKLFPMPDPERYDPFVPEQDKKCVSLVNETDLSRSAVRALHGSKVTVVGFAIRYDELMDGESVADRLLFKKYFNDKMVHNFCLRDFVFVVTGIES